MEETPHNNVHPKGCPAHRDTFRKAERLCSRKTVQALFVGGKAASLSAFPLRAVFMTLDDSCGSSAATSNVQVLVSVSKRKFKHAVDRNRVKRQIREAYRLNKQLLLQHTTAPTIAIAFIWLDNKHHPSALIHKRMTTLLQRIGERLAADERGRR